MRLLYAQTADGEVMRWRFGQAPSCAFRKLCQQRRLSAAVRRHFDHYGDYRATCTARQATGALAGTRIHRLRCAFSNSPVVVATWCLASLNAGKISCVSHDPIGASAPRSLPKAGNTASQLKPGSAAPADTAVQGAASDSTAAPGIRIHRRRHSRRLTAPPDSTSSVPAPTPALRQPAFTSSEARSDVCPPAPGPSRRRPERHRCRHNRRRYSLPPQPQTTQRRRPNGWIELGLALHLTMIGVPEYCAFCCLLLHWLVAER